MSARDLVPVQTPALRPPAMTVQLHPLDAPTEPQPVAAGATIASLQPAGTTAVRCYLNGAPVYRLTKGQIRHHARLVKIGGDAQGYLARAAAEARNWQRVRVQPGDVIEWRDEPQNKDALRSVLQIAVVVAAAWVGGVWGAAIAIGGSLAINALLPPTVPDMRQDQAGSLYNANLSGNAARLDQPIWKNCGLVMITPPFAAQPYYEYIDQDGDNLDNEQYFYAVYAIGVGNHNLKAACIGKTPIGNFSDVLVAQYLPPGVKPSRALANVVTSSEVSQLELEQGQYVGGYVACQPRRRAKSIGIDIMCPQGLGKGGNLTVAWRVEARDIDDYGRAISAWRVIGTESRTANTNTPQRWSSRYLLAAPARVEVRVVRTDLKDTDTAARHELQWIGLRAYLGQIALPNPFDGGFTISEQENAPLNPDTAHFEVVMRASKQLSASSQRDVRLAVHALARTWSPTTGWGPEVETRNPAWWLADLWRSTTWGEGLPDDRIDLAGLYAFAQECDQRQDRFDYSFANGMNAWDAAQTIARAGRARCFRRYGVNTLARDKLATLPKTAFTHRTATDMVMHEQLPGRDVADGVVVEYLSNITWDTDTIECPAPGYTVSDESDPRYNPALPKMAAPVYWKLDGVTGRTHAEREGLYEAAVRALRTRTVSCKTDMLATVSHYMAPVRWLPEIAGYGQTGDVAFWTPSTLVMGLTEPPDWSKGDLYLTLTRDDGSLTTPVRVLPGPTEWDVTLPAAPDFDLVLDDGTRDRPRFLLGTLADCDELVKVTAITDGGQAPAEDGMPGAQLYEVAAVVDDPRVHSADVHLLPGPGAIQDPVEFPDGSAGGGALLLVNMSEHPIVEIYGLNTEEPLSASITLTNDGRITWATPTSIYTPRSGTYSTEWLKYGAATPAQAAQFEVRATYTGEALGVGLDFNSPYARAAAPTGDALGTWLSLGTSRSWTNTLPRDRSSWWDCSGTVSTLLIEIREASSGVVQSSRKVWLTCGIYDDGKASAGA